MRTLCALLFAFVFVSTAVGAPDLSRPKEGLPKLPPAMKQEKEKPKEEAKTEIVFALDKDVKALVFGNNIKRVDAINGVIVVKGKVTVQVENRTKKDIVLYVLINDEELTQKLEPGRGATLQGDSEDFVTIQLSLKSQKKKSD